MTPASIDDIKNELKNLPPKKVLELTLRLARFKKENKELLTYLLFESHDEQGYIRVLQNDVSEQFDAIIPTPVSLAKKQYRKILRGINRQIKYIGSKSAAVELLLHFCEKLKEKDTSLHPKLQVIYFQQLSKEEKLLPAVDEDLQFEYVQKINMLRDTDLQEKPVIKKWWKGIRKK